MDDPISTSVRRLAAEMKEASFDSVDVPGTIAKLVGDAVRLEVDPYLTLGVLVESIAQTVASSIPQQKRKETAREVARMLLNRFAAQGLMR
jgi:hypothetical protein